jgi:tight adherence protein B
MSYGMDLRQAFEKMSQRLGLIEINYMIAAMRIQSSTGGNLAEVLSALSNVMREKVKMKAKVKALSAEARFSGLILAALPVLVVLALVLMNPHYYDAAETSDLLKAILAGAAALMLVGIFLVRKFVNIRI